MLHARKWSVEIYIDEHDDDTRAEARLTAQDGMVTIGHGRARRNPHDANVPETGDDDIARAVELALLRRPSGVAVMRP